MASASKQMVSPIQISQGTRFKGLNETNYLTNAFMTKPEKLGSVMAFASGLKQGSVLPLLTGGIGNTVKVKSREYTWDLHTENERVIEVSEDSPAVLSGTPGIGGSIFPIILSEKFFDLNDNIVADDGTQLHIVSEGQQKGPDQVEYLVQHVELDDHFFIDPKMIKRGAKFSKDYTTVAEYSKRGGGVSFATPFTLKNQLSTLRKTYEVSRNAAKAKIVIELINPRNPEQRTTYWTTALEWTAMGEWYREQDRHFIYSRYNKSEGKTIKLKDGSNRPILHGAGLRQQIAPANIRFYTKLTYGILEDFLSELCFNSTSDGTDYKFLALTGREGMKQFDRAIQEYRNGAGITITDHGTFITGKGSELTLTGHFKTVEFLNGITLTIRHFPPYDDIDRNRAKHPLTKKPIESYRFTILNFGQFKGQANIRKVALEDSEDMMWNVSGSTNPAGNTAKSVNESRNSSVDGFEVHYLSECGIQVQDPTSCGELILQVF